MRAALVAISVARLIVLDEARFQEQRLDERRPYPQQRLVGERDGALGDGRDVAGEAQGAEEVEEGRVVGAYLGEVAEVFVRVAKAGGVGEGCFQAGGEHIGAAERGVPDIQVEGRRTGAAGAPGDVGGILVVEVSREGRTHGCFQRWAGKMVLTPGPSPHGGEGSLPQAGAGEA